MEQIRPASERLCKLFHLLEATHPRRVASDQSVDPLYFALVVDFRDTLERIARCCRDLETVAPAPRDAPKPCRLADAHRRA